MIDVTDDVARIAVSQNNDTIVSALTTSYAHATTHIAEFAKLQYQLVAIAYGLAGAAIAFFGSQLGQSSTQQPGSQIQGAFLLFLPPIFNAIAFVQIYLHTQIKRYGRYVNYDLRPKIEALIQAELRLPTDTHLSFWNWEDVYLHDISPSRLTRLHTLLVRVLSLLIMVLPIVPAIASIGLYEFINRGSTFTDLETTVRWINVISVLVTILLIGIVGWVNLVDLERQAKQQGEIEKKTLLSSLQKQDRKDNMGNDEAQVVDTYLEIETDPTMIALAVLLSENPKNRARLLKRLAEVAKKGTVKRKSDETNR